MESVWETENKILASKLEYDIKELNKQQKEELIKEGKKLEEYLGTKLESSLYKKVI